MASETVDDEEKLEDRCEELVGYLETILENQQILNDYLQKHYKHRSAWSYICTEYGLFVVSAFMTGLFLIAMAIFQ